MSVPFYETVNNFFVNIEVVFLLILAAEIFNSFNSSVLKVCGLIHAIALSMTLCELKYNIYKNIFMNEDCNISE